jgi:hypothetical protein
MAETSEVRAWMNVRPHIAPLGGEVARVLDAWAEGGVDGIVIGPLLSPARVALFEPQLAVYRRFGVTPPDAPSVPQTEVRREVDQILRGAADRGWTILVMSAESGAGPEALGRARADPGAAAARVARMVDVFEQFPMAHGAIIDSLEWGYEIDVHHGGFRSSPRTQRQYIFWPFNPTQARPRLRATAAREDRPTARPDRMPLRHYATDTPRRFGAPPVQNSADGTWPWDAGRLPSSASGPLQGGAPGRPGSSATILPAGGSTVPAAPAARAHLVKRPDLLTVVC